MDAQAKSGLQLPTLRHVSLSGGVLSNALLAEVAKVLRRGKYSPRSDDAPWPGCVSKPNATSGAAVAGWPATSGTTTGLASQRRSFSRG